MAYIYLEKNKKAPILVLLHGTGGNEESLIHIGEYLHPEASLLGLRGEVKEGTMNRFFHRYAEGKFDLVDLALRTGNLLATLEELALKYDLELSQMILVGYSNGANIGGHLLLSEETPITQGIFFHSMLLEKKAYLKTTGNKRVWLSHGSQDPLVSNTEFAELEEAYNQRGISVTSYKDEMGHGIEELELINAKKWLAEGAN